jgi:hypothetical protein
MPGSSIMCCADADVAINVERIAAAPSNLNVVISVLLIVDPR